MKFLLFVSALAVASAHIVPEGIRGSNAAISADVPVPGPEAAVAAKNVASVAYRLVGAEGWCTDAAGREGTARYHVKGNLAAVSAICSGDASCVAYAFGAHGSSSIYSNKSGSCSGNCANTAWIDDSSLIVGASGDSRYTCLVKVVAAREQENNPTPHATLGTMKHFSAQLVPGNPVVVGDVETAVSTPALHCAWFGHGFAISCQDGTFHSCGCEEVSQHC